MYYVCIYVYAVVLNLYFYHLTSTMVIFYLCMWPLCDTYYNTNTFLGYFIRGTFFWDNALRISFHPTPLTTTICTTAYFVLPKFSATSQFTLGTVPTAHEQQNGLPW